MNRRTTDALGSLGLGTPPGTAVLIRDLGSAQAPVRNYARHRLVAAGHEAIPALTWALEHASIYGRSQAAKALGEIGDPVAAPALVNALDDNCVSVHLMATEALVALGKPALSALLKALIIRPGSYWLRRGTQIVLRAEVHQHRRSLIQPLVQALEAVDGDAAIAAAAQQVWDALKTQENS